MPADYAPMAFQVDRDTARMLIGAISYAPPLEHTVYAAALDEERKQKKAAKKATQLDDAASINSFSSRISLLKSKFPRKHRA